MMGTTIPYGYRIIDGKAIISEKEAARLKTYFRKYLAGNSMSASAKAAKLPFCAATYPRLFTKKEYCGTDYYPAIITEEYQEKLIAEWKSRQKEFSSDRYQRPEKAVRIYTNFRLSERKIRRSDDAAQYAENLYRSIRPTRSRRHNEKLFSSGVKHDANLMTKSDIRSDDHKKRVAAYCRVSTDSEMQENSYDIQCRYYTELIRSHCEWELAAIYADSGISGTSTRYRTQFNRMIEDCENGKIDMIITKSISRWARNTVDSLNNIRKLKDLGIPVYFEKESINTLDSKGEVLITIMSCLAQQESDSISRNVRLGIQFHMQQGKRNFNANNILGYGKDEAIGKNRIISEEADLVRRIYREYLEGCSPGMIAAHLASEGIPTASGKGSWNQSTITSILKNEKYCGNFLMQKYYVKDFLTHKVAKNTGQLPKYLIEDHHDPIVPKMIFSQVQDEMQRRSALKYDPVKIRCGSATALRGRMYCGICGRTLKRYTAIDPFLTDWRCRARAYRKRTSDLEVSPRCPCRNVREEEAKAAVIVAMNRLPAYRNKLIELNKAQQDNRINMSPLERAEAANHDIQRRILLELLDIMRQYEGKDSVRRDVPVSFASPSCDDYEEFFKRTRFIPGSGAIGSDGKIRLFLDEMVIRYFDRIIVMETGYQVKFKAGITVNVPV